MAFGAMFKSLAALAIAGLVLLGAADAQLKVDFYKDSCPKAEQIVLEELEIILKQAKSLAGPLLRLHFHDCFVRGCDASVLLNSKGGTGEKDAFPNLTLRGFGSIERIKRKLEKACPGVVSCADILALAARDAVYITGGPAAFWDVETGRRDGNISVDQDALNNLPPPQSDMSDLITFFGDVGLDKKDIIVLSGAHTIGTAHCDSFSDSIYNFSGNGDLDPSIDKRYVPFIKKKCPNLEATNIVEMDPGSFTTFDLSYYKYVSKRRGLFHSDRALLSDADGAAYVKKAAAASSLVEFFKDFAESMNKMGRINVLTGSQGSIRKVCGAWVD